MNMECNTAQANAGQALVEFALTAAALVAILLVIFYTFVLGITYLALDQTAREGARIAAQEGTLNQRVNGVIAAQLQAKNIDPANVTVSSQIYSYNGGAFTLEADPVCPYNGFIEIGLSMPWNAALPFDMTANLNLTTSYRSECWKTPTP